NLQMNAFDLQGAVNLTLNQLGITGGYNGILAGYASGSTGLTVTNSALYANTVAGIDLETSNDNATISGNTFYGVPGGSTTDDESYGIKLVDSGSVVSGNTVFDTGAVGISAFGGSITVRGNNVFGNPIGIDAGDFLGDGSLVLIDNNTVHDNDGTGIRG